VVENNGTKPHFYVTQRSHIGLGYAGLSALQHGNGIKAESLLYPSPMCKRWVDRGENNGIETSFQPNFSSQNNLSRKQDDNISSNLITSLKLKMRFQRHRLTHCKTLFSKDTLSRRVVTLFLKPYYLIGKRLFEACNGSCLTIPKSVAIKRRKCF
jgi:hypothetical protein